MTRVYLDVGGLGYCPERIQASQLDWIRFRSLMGPSSVKVCDFINRGFGSLDSEEQLAFSGLARWEGLAKVRQRLGEHFGSLGPEQVVFSLSTTDSIRQVLDGADLSIGDEILVAENEHDSTLNLVGYAGRRFGSRCRTVNVATLTASAAEIVTRYTSTVTPATRVLILSHVEYRTGRILPVSDIVDSCRRRARGLVVIVDGAHSFGQARLDVRALGCDFFATAGHKWMLAPEGSGILITVRDRAWSARMGFSLFSFHSLAMSADNPLRREPPEWVKQARLANPIRIELGTAINLGALVGLNEALAMVEEVGIDVIVAHQRRVRKLLSDGLEKMPGVKVVEPPTEEERSAIVAFRFHGSSEPGILLRFLNLLQSKYGVIARGISSDGLVRLSPSYMLGDELVGEALEGVRAALQDGARLCS